MMDSQFATLGADHLSTHFTVHVNDITGKRKKGADGRRTGEYNSFGQTTTFTGHLQRLDTHLSLEIAWVDLENTGHRHVLPHQVVEAICNSRDRLIKKSRSQAAKRAYETRLENGTQTKRDTTTRLFKKES